MTLLEGLISVVVEGVIGTVLYFILAGPLSVEDGIAFGFALLFVIYANGFAEISMRLKKKGI